MRKIFQHSRSLQTTLLISFTVCISLLLAFIVLTILPGTSDLLMRNAIDRTRETVLQSADSVNIYINGLLGIVNYTAATISDKIGSEDDADWKSYVDYLTDSNSDITTIAVFDADGAVLHATGNPPNEDPRSIRGNPWFQMALTLQGTSTYFSTPHVQYLFGQQRNFVVSLSHAFYYYDGGGSQQGGVILMDVAYSAFSELIEGTRLSTSGYLYMMDENNQIIFHPHIRMLYDGLIDEDTASVLSQTLGVTRDTDSQGRSRTLIIESLYGTRWRIVGVAYFDEISGILNDFKNTFAVVILCAALLSLIPASLIAYSVTKPILHLKHKMQKVEAGDLSVTIGERSYSEIRAVSVAFNHMLARIRSLMDQVVQEQEKKRLYELNALQAQINPHFLYNTLDSIIWMQERGKKEEAITMVSALARLFRISISKGRSVITVGEELEHVRNYLIIQKMRFREKFTYEITADEQAQAEYTIKLIIQPLVENAISHGFNQTVRAQLHIHISATAAGDRLVFRVEDDGVGMPPEQVSQLLLTPTGKSGIGLKNVHERIQLMCGAEYGLTIESVEEKGTVVTVCLPRPLEVTE